MLSLSMNAETNPESSTMCFWKPSPEAEMLNFLSAVPQLYFKAVLPQFMILKQFTLLPNQCLILVNAS